MSRMDETGSYSLGVILSKMMRATSHEKILECVEEQRQMSEEEVLGEILIAKGLITRDQLLVALEAQQGLRSKKKHERAMAMSKIAECSSRNVVQFASRIQDSSDDTREKITGTDFQAIRPEMLMSKGGKGE